MQKGTVSYKISNCGCWVIRGPTNMKPFLTYECEQHRPQAVAEPVEEPDASEDREEIAAPGETEAGVESAETPTPPAAEAPEVTAPAVEGEEPPPPQGLSTYSEPPKPDPLGLDI